MSFEKYSPDELEVKERARSFRGEVEFFNTPITSRENILRLYQGKTPMWIPFTGEMTNVKADCDPENQARSGSGGIDGWGVEWVWVPAANGAMVKPGNPKVTDINNWEEVLTVPHPEEWDWEGCYERNKGKKSDDKIFEMTVGSCLFERLIAVMDYAGAAMALIDEDQKEGVHRFFRAVTDSRKEYYTQMKKWFNPEVVNFNDDWGTQRAESFSVATAREMLLPYVKETVEHVHSLGMYIDLHSCGFVENFVPLFIEAGFDSWGGQPLNDKPKLKKQYGDKMIFTHELDLPADYTDEQLTDAVEKFMLEFGYDNRVFFGGNMANPRLHRAIYEASRRNYDRLVAEGKAIL